MGLTDRWVRTFFIFLSEILAQRARTTASREPRAGRCVAYSRCLLPPPPGHHPARTENQIPLVRASVRARRRPPPIALLFRRRRRGGGSEAAEGIAAAPTPPAAHSHQRPPASPR